MTKNRATTKVHIPIYAACVLFCFTLISVHFTSGLYAKYAAEANGGDFARVIRFGEITVTESGDFAADNRSLLIPGVNLTKKAVLSFDGSESAAYIFVIITLSSHWNTTDNESFDVSAGDKTQLRFRVAQGWTYLSADGSGTYIYYRELAPGASLSADIIAEDGLITVSDQITKGELDQMDGMYIRLGAAAAQSGGFESPAAAWESVAAKQGGSPLLAEEQLAFSFGKQGGVVQ